MNRQKPNNTLWYSMGLAAVLCICLLVTTAGTALARYKQTDRSVITVNVRPPSQIYVGSMRLVPKEEATAPTDPATETTIPETTTGAATDTTVPEAATEANTETTAETLPPEVEMVEVFDPTISPEWKKVGDDTMQMRLVVANGTSETDYSEKTQYVKLQMIGTLGLWNGTEAATISVQVPAADLETEETDATEETTVPEETTVSPETEENGEEEMAELQGTVTYIEEGSLLYSTYGNGWLYTFLLPDGETEYIWKLPGGKFAYLDLIITLNCAAVGNPSFLQPRIISELVTE